MQSFLFGNFFFFFLQHPFVAPQQLVSLPFHANRWIHEYYSCSCCSLSNKWHLAEETSFVALLWCQQAGRDWHFLFLFGPFILRLSQMWQEHMTALRTVGRGQHIRNVQKGCHRFYEYQWVDGRFLGKDKPLTGPQSLIHLHSGIPLNWFAEDLDIFSPWIYEQGNTFSFCYVYAPLINLLFVIHWQ